MASFMDRVVGAAKLDVRTYEEVEADTTATGQAMAVVVLSSVATGIGSGEGRYIMGALGAARRGAESIEPTLAEARKTLKSTREVVENLGKETEGLGGDVSQTLAELRERLARTEQTFEALEATLRGADDARVDASKTLVELERALKAFRNLVEYIETHPEAILQGKEKK